LLDVDRAKASYGFAEALLMVRPDSHIAWRGQAAPPEANRLFDRLLGRALKGGGREPELGRKAASIHVL
jgi:hypothetical protein